MIGRSGNITRGRDRVPAITYMALPSACCHHRWQREASRPIIEAPWERHVDDGWAADARTIVSRLVGAQHHLAGADAGQSRSVSAGHDCRRAPLVGEQWYHQDH